MKSTTSKIATFLALATTLPLMTETSEAGWFRHGSSGSYGSSGSSGSYGSSGSSGSRGSSGSFGRRWRRYHSSGSWGSSGSYGSGSYGSHGSSGSSGGHVNYGGPATDAAPATTGRTRPRVGLARITMDLPEDAVVYLVDQRMTLTGTHRSFLLPNIPEGKSYDYPIKVEVTRNGQPVVAEHNESVSAGMTYSVQVSEQAGQLVVSQGTPERLVAGVR